MNQICKVFFVLFLSSIFACPALAVDFAFHGDLNNRFGLFTNQIGWLNSDQKGVIEDGDRNDSFASIKYRLWTEAASNDGAVKGVFAVEIGAVRFGKGTDATGPRRERGGSFSGDGVNIETRWAYTDFQLPNIGSKARFKIGLFPIKVNSFLWSETATGVQFNAENYQLAWIRGREELTGGDGNWGDNDLDNLLGRYDFNNDATKAGLFVLYQWQDTSGPSDPMNSMEYQIKQLDNVEFDLWTLGTDGSWSTPVNNMSAFVNWDLMYQNGSFDNVAFTDSLSGVTAATMDYDLSAFFLHADLGLSFGRTTITYTGWYASGDDDPNDDEFNAFITTDLDREDSIVIMEGGYTDDVYFTERPELFDKGFIMNKLALDHKTTEKLKLGAAVLYMMTAEDIEYVDVFARPQKQDEIGFEIDAYASYMLYPNLELAINAGYLFAGDAMDAFEDLSTPRPPATDPLAGQNGRDGKADNDIFFSTARVRYKF